MKLDAALGTGASPLRSAVDTARAAESLGFAGLWTSETKHDPFLPLAVAAGAAGEVRLGTSVAIAFSRSPMELAQTAWDLQDVSGGRFVLGLGTQVRAHVERRFSMPFGKPVPRLRDYVGALRAIWRSFGTGEPLRYEGEFYTHTLLSPFFDPGPIGHPRVPVHVAGVNAGLASLAGELCDGFHVHPFHSPEYLRKTVEPAIRAGAGRAGRDHGEVEVVASVFFLGGETGEEAERRREELRAQVSFYASTPSYRVVLEAHGWEDAGGRLGALAREKKWREMPALVTDEMLGAFVVEAPPDEVGPALRERYGGLVDRVSLYRPVVPGEEDGFWRDVVGSFAGG